MKYHLTVIEFFFVKKNDIRILSYTNAKKLKLSCHRPIIGAFEVICNKKNSMNTNQQLNINLNINNINNFQNNKYAQ